MITTDLIVEETLNLYPERRGIENGEFILQCSKAFYEYFHKEIREAYRFTAFMSPVVGKFNIVQDLEQGYKITKI